MPSDYSITFTDGTVTEVRRVFNPTTSSIWFGCRLESRTAVSPSFSDVKDALIRLLAALQPLGASAVLNAEGEPVVNAPVTLPPPAPANFNAMLRALSPRQQALAARRYAEACAFLAPLNARQMLDRLEDPLSVPDVELLELDTALSATLLELEKLTADPKPPSYLRLGGEKLDAIWAIRCAVQAESAVRRNDPVAVLLRNGRYSAASALYCRDHSSDARTGEDWGPYARGLDGGVLAPFVEAQ